MLLEESIWSGVWFLEPLRLVEWLERVGRCHRALGGSELAWSEIPSKRKLFTLGKPWNKKQKENGRGAGRQRSCRHTQDQRSLKTHSTRQCYSPSLSSLRGLGLDYSMYREGLAQSGKGAVQSHLTASVFCSIPKPYWFPTLLDPANLTDRDLFSRLSSYHAALQLIPSSFLDSHDIPRGFDSFVLATRMNPVQPSYILYNDKYMAYLNIFMKEMNTTENMTANT